MIEPRAHTEEAAPSRSSHPAADPLADQERAYLTLLFNKYRGPLHRYLSGLVRSVDDAAELVQETYFRVMRHTESVKLESAARAYLFQTATNIAREYYRRRARRHADRHVGLEEMESIAGEAMDEQDVLREEALSRLRIEMKEMPPELRDILVLHRFQHRTYADIARALGVSTRTVERRVSRAMDLLAVRMRGAL